MVLRAPHGVYTSHIVWSFYFNSSICFVVFSCSNSAHKVAAIFVRLGHSHDSNSSRATTTSQPHHSHNTPKPRPHLDQASTSLQPNLDPASTKPVSHLDQTSTIAGQTAAPRRVGLWPAVYTPFSANLRKCLF